MSAESTTSSSPPSSPPPAPTTTSTTSEALKKEAETSFKQQDYKKAIELYTNLILEDPTSQDSALYFANRSFCNFQLDNFQEALDDGSSAVTIRPDWARGYFRVAVAAEALILSSSDSSSTKSPDARAAQAYEAYSKSSSLDPANKECKTKFRLFRKKNIERITHGKSQEEICEMALKLVDPSSCSSTTTTVAATTNFVPLYGEAIEYLTAAIDLDPSSPFAAKMFARRSFYNFKLNQFPEAFDDASLAAGLLEEWGIGWLFRGISGAKAEKFEDANESFQKYDELSKNNKNNNSNNKQSHPRDDENGSNATSTPSSIATELLLDDESLFTKAEIDAAKEKVRTELRVAATIQRLREQSQRNGSKFLMSLKGKERQQAADELLDISLIENFDFDMICVALKAGANLGVYNEWIPHERRNVPRSILSLGITNRPCEPGESKEKLRKYDNALLYIIDEMVKQDIDFHPSTLLFASFWRDDMIPNPNIVLALLQTGKFNVNQCDTWQGIAPLHAAVGIFFRGNPQRTVPTEVLDTIRVLISTSTSPGRNQSPLNPNVPATNQQIRGFSPLMVTRHPDIAKLLLNPKMYLGGVAANPNFSCVSPDDRRVRVGPLEEATRHVENPRRLELLRVLVGAGAKYIPDGREGKSTSVLKQYFQWNNAREAPKLPVSTIEQEVRIIADCIRKQGLLLRWQSPSTREDISFVHLAIVNIAPVSVIELLCSLSKDSDPVNTVDFMSVPTLRVIAPLHCIESLFRGYVHNVRPLESIFQIFKTLVNVGNADMFCKLPLGDDVLCRALLSSVRRDRIPNGIDKMKKIILDKYGQEYWDRCLEVSGISCDQNNDTANGSSKKKNKKK